MQKLAYTGIQAKVYAELTFKKSTKTLKEVEAQIELEYTAFTSDLTEEWIPSPFADKNEYYDYDAYNEQEDEVDYENLRMINEEGRGRGGRGRGGGLNDGGISRAGKGHGRGDGRGGREEDEDDG